MTLIERLSNKIAVSISSSLGYNKDQEEIIAYGAFGFIHTLLSFMLVIIFGLILNVPVEAFVISFTAAILRKYSGGVHASTPNRCTLIGLLVSIGFALLAKLIVRLSDPIIVIILFTIFYLFSFVTVSKFSPVDTPNKPITKEEVKVKLRKGSIAFLFIILIFSVLLLVAGYQLKKYTYGFILSTGIGVAWQSFMLTTKGHKFITFVDGIFDIKKRR